MLPPCPPSPPYTQRVTFTKVEVVEASYDRPLTGATATIEASPPSSTSPSTAAAAAFNGGILGHGCKRVDVVLQELPPGAGKKLRLRVHAREDLPDDPRNTATTKYFTPSTFEYEVEVVD